MIVWRYIIQPKTQQLDKVLHFKSSFGRAVKHDFAAVYGCERETSSFCPEDHANFSMYNINVWTRKRTMEREDDEIAGILKAHAARALWAKIEKIFSLVSFYFVRWSAFSSHAGLFKEKWMKKNMDMEISSKG